MYNIFKVPTFRLNLQPSSGESEKIIRKRHGYPKRFVIDVGKPKRLAQQL